MEIYLLTALCLVLALYYRGQRVDPKIKEDYDYFVEATGWTKGKSIGAELIHSRRYTEALESRCEALSEAIKVAIDREVDLENRLSQALSERDEQKRTYEDLVARQFEAFKSGRPTWLDEIYDCASAEPVSLAEEREKHCGDQWAFDGRDWRYVGPDLTVPMTSPGCQTFKVTSDKPLQIGDPVYMGDSEVPIGFATETVGADETVTISLTHQGEPCGTAKIPSEDAAPIFERPRNDGGSVIHLSNGETLDLKKPVVLTGLSDRPLRNGEPGWNVHSFHSEKCGEYFRYDVWVMRSSGRITSCQMFDVPV